MIKKLLFVVLSAISLNACVLDNYGYPEHAVLNSNGDPIVIIGHADTGVCGLSIIDENSHAVNDNIQGITDTITVTYKWLTLKAATGDNKIIIYATPNTTGKDRSFWCHAMSDESGPDFKVTPKK
jgi:uncharacterized lipoprotein YehR (DUF1307 family)